MKRAMALASAVALGLGLLVLLQCWHGKDGGGTTQHTCDELCSRASQCGTACVPADCLPYCTNTLNFDTLSCVSLSTCEKFDTCVCGAGDDTGGDDAGDDAGDDSGDDASDDSGDDTGTDCSNNHAPQLFGVQYQVNGATRNPPVVVSANDLVDILYTYYDEDCNLPGGQIFVDMDDAGFQSLGTLPAEIGCSSQQTGMIYGFELTRPIGSGLHHFSCYWTDVCGIASNHVDGSFAVLP